jgi:hypothetical protein
LRDTCESLIDRNQAVNGLPNYSANPGNSNLNIVNKPLSAALIFFPLGASARGVAIIVILT